MTMRYAHWASERNSAAIERLVGFKTPGRVESSNRLVAKSVTGKSRRPGKSLKPATEHAKVAELADAPDLGSGG